jgi:hypothetical protein
MTILSNIEIQLLEEFVLSNNYTEFSEAHFHHALAQIVPIWRSEQIAGCDKVYWPYSSSIAYQEYINNLIGKTNEI